MSKWQPIETAPIGREILVLAGDTVFTAIKSAEGWNSPLPDAKDGTWSDLRAVPVAWMPIPPEEVGGHLNWQTFDQLPDEGVPFIAARQLEDYEWDVDLLRRNGTHYYWRDYTVEDFDYTYWAYVAPPDVPFQFKPYVIRGGKPE